MKRLSNHIHSEKSHAAPQVQYVDRIVEVSVEKRVEVPVLSEPQIIEKIVEKQVEISAPEVDLQPLYDKYNELTQIVVEASHRQANILEEYREVINNQGKMLLHMKKLYQLDRSKRLMLINRLRKEKKKYKKLNLKIKLAIGASLLLSVISMFIK